MRVRCQIHVPTALPRGEALSHIEWDDERAPNRSGSLGEKKLLSLPGIDLRYVGFAPFSLVTTLTELSSRELKSHYT
jgi:hypothetical protein